MTLNSRYTSPNLHYECPTILVPLVCKLDRNSNHNKLQKKVTHKWYKIDGVEDLDSKSTCPKSQAIGKFRFSLFLLLNFPKDLNSLISGKSDKNW